ncbi:MAG: hypothetical protein U5R30_18005 [Deltaproteobacteria bacterium]|nr:hypothetical protein [Deltaproteobacteria bacterium]
MHPLTHSATHPDLLNTWGLMIGFGAYHGLNPGKGWLFALALGLQQKSERAIWQSLLPISIGHAVSIILVAAVVLAAGHMISTGTLRFVTAVVLLAFGVIKLFTYYRHPRWVGMRVGMRDLFFWSFLMAAAHGAGLMVAPTLLEISAAGQQGAGLTSGTGMILAVGLHTLAMLGVMAIVAVIVYRKIGLKILRQSWINFDLIWAVALLVVGATALYFAFASAAHA